MRISMPRGDIKWVRFMINTPNGTATDIDFTNIYFTVKKKTNDRQFLFQKSYKRGEIYKLALGDYQLKIDPADTNKLLVGDYKFDIQISYKNLMKESFVGDFVLKEEVTFYENEDGEEEETDYMLPQTPEKTAVILSVPDYHVIELETPTEIIGIGGSYNNLEDIPTINGIPLSGDLTLEDLGIQPAGTQPEALSPDELEELIGEPDALEPDDLDNITDSDDFHDDSNNPQGFTEEELEDIING